MRTQPVIENAITRTEFLMWWLRAIADTVMDPEILGFGILLYLILFA